MKEQKKGTFRNFIEENAKTICGAGLVLTGCFIGAAVGTKITAARINASLYAMFSEKKKKKKTFTETMNILLKKN